MWLCVEYCYDDFKRMTGPDGFEFTYGTTIMGLSVLEGKVETHLQKDLIDKAVLEETLRNEDIRCWWFCNTDFDGMTVWHKDYTGEDLLNLLKDEIREQVELLGGRISTAD